MTDRRVRSLAIPTIPEQNSRPDHRAIGAPGACPATQIGTSGVLARSKHIRRRAAWDNAANRRLGAHALKSHRAMGDARCMDFGELIRAPSEGDLVPPGWYSDPWQVAPSRWWDGATWTGYVSPPNAGSGA